MNVAVIGGGSSYTPELVEGLLARSTSVPTRRITLMDPNAERVSLTAALARRMAKQQNSTVEIACTGDLRQALHGANYVLTQIRVGGAHARIADEKLGRRHGIIGQETTGVGGFAKALRTIPRVLEIAHAMEELCPDAILLNFTNPAGIVTEALIKHSSIKSVGLCNIPIGISMEVARKFKCEPADIELDYVGLNHLSWIRGFRIRAEDRTDEILHALIEDAGEEWTPEPIRDAMQAAMRRLGMYCNPYLQYFYATREALEAQNARATTRGEDVLEIEKSLFATYADADLDHKPEELSRRGGAHYSTAALNLIEAIENDSRATQIVCCRNDGSIPTLDNDAAIEAPSTIGAAGAAALPQAMPEKSILGLMQCIKAYESLTVDAAVNGDRDAAIQAMLTNPLMPGISGCEKMLGELLELNEPFLGGTFFNDTAGVAHGS